MHNSSSHYYTDEHLHSIIENTSNLSQYHIQTIPPSEFSEGFLALFEQRWIVINHTQTRAYSLPDFAKSFNREQAIDFLTDQNAEFQTA